MNTESLMLDLAKTWAKSGKSFTLHDLIQDGSKPENDPMSRLHNHEVKEAAYRLLDSGKIALVDGNVVIK